MTANKALTPEEAAKLLALPPKTRGKPGGTYRHAPGTSKVVRIDLTDRSWPMWFKLSTTATECNVPNHDEEESERKRMCVEIGDLMVCRYCYVNNRDSSS